MKLSLAYSPCPNDCFIFDAMIHGKVDTEGLEFAVSLEDVESLNKNALRMKHDITKLSFHAYAYVISNYILLRSGAALGYNCGPLLITTPHQLPKILERENQHNVKVAIPGKMTTANFLLSIAYPGLTNKKEYVFSDIEEAVLKGEADAGLIIHESRFTYEEKGLKKIMDLGQYWESLIHAPIPLGGIFMRRGADEALQCKVNRIIKRSVEFAFSHPDSCMGYVQQHAQEMKEEVMRKHIDLYVNEFSIDLGLKGRNAVELLFSKAAETNLFQVGNEKIMID